MSTPRQVFFTRWSAAAVEASVDPFTRARFPWLARDIENSLLNGSVRGGPAPLESWHAMNGEQCVQEVITATRANREVAEWVVTAVVYAYSLIGTPVTVDGVVEVAVTAVAWWRNAERTRR